MTNTNTSASAKMTKKDWFEILAGIVEASDYENKEGALEFIDHEKELLEKKKSTAKESKAQKANTAIMSVLTDVLLERAVLDTASTISELMEDERLKTYQEGDSIIKMSNQKLSSVMKKLVDNGTVKKEVIKKKAYFSIV